MTSVRLADITLPDFGMPLVRPTLPAGTHARRLDTLVDRLRTAGLDAAFVYADREHFANMAYLTDFEPRFEEALLLVVPGRTPLLLTGPENTGLARDCAIGQPICSVTSWANSSACCISNSPSLVTIVRRSSGLIRGQGPVWNARRAASTAGP